MPTVPRKQEEEVRPTPFPNVTRQPVASEEAFGGGSGLAKVGSLVSDISTLGAKIAVQQKKSADDTVVTEADTRAGIEQSALEQEIRGMRGKKSAGIIDHLRGEWPKRMEKIEQGLSNDEQRSAFRKKNAARFLTTLGTGRNLTVTYGEAYAKEVTEGAVVGHRNYAVEHFQDPDKVENSIYAMAQERTTEALNNGLGEVDDKGNITLDPAAKAIIGEDVSTTVALIYKRKVTEAAGVALVNEKLSKELLKEADAFREHYSTILDEEFGSNYSGKDITSMDYMRKIGVNEIIKQHQAVIDTQQESNGAVLMDEALKGKFDDLAKLDELRSAGIKNSPSGIKSDAFVWISNYLTTPAFLASKMKRMELGANIPKEFFKIDENNDGTVDHNARFEDVARFRMAALEAQKAGEITERELAAQLKMTDLAFNNGIATQSYINAKNIWQYYNNWFPGKMNGFKISVDGNVVKQSMSKEQMDRAMNFVGRGLMNYMQNFEITEEKIPEVTQLFLGKFLQQEFPELVGKSELPNAIMTMEASFRSLFAKKSTEPKDFIVQKVDVSKIPHDPATEKVQVDELTGRTRVVPR